MNVGRTLKRRFARSWVELVYQYQYRPERMRFEVKVPRRTPNDLADLVIYADKDDELKAPWFVFECKRADLSDAEFAQAVEQACGNRASLDAKFLGTIRVALSTDLSGITCLGTIGTEKRYHSIGSAAAREIRACG